MFDKQTRVLRKFSELNLGFSDLTTKFMLKDEFSESLFQVCYQTPFDYVMLSSNETDSKERWVDSMSMRLSSENENEICFFEGNLSKDKIKYLNLIVSKSVYAGACAIQGNTLVLRNCEPDLYSQVFDYIVSFFASFNWLYFIRKATSEQNRHIKNPETPMCVGSRSPGPNRGQRERKDLDQTHRLFGNPPRNRRLFSELQIRRSAR